MRYLGIDNGKDGAIIVLKPDGKIEEKYKTPIIKGATKKGKKLARDEYDIVGMKQILLKHGEPMLFGENSSKGIRFNQDTWSLEVIDASESPSDEKDNESTTCR